MASVFLLMHRQLGFGISSLSDFSCDLIITVSGFHLSHIVLKSDLCLHLDQGLQGQKATAETVRRRGAGDQMSAFPGGTQQVHCTRISGIGCLLVFLCLCIYSCRLDR